MHGIFTRYKNYIKFVKENILPDNVSFYVFPNPNAIEMQSLIMTHTTYEHM